MDEMNYMPTTINEYFSWIERTIAPNTALYEAAHAFLEQECARYNQQKSDGPFLSIITRTQGKRPEMLREVLLCLTGQTNTDFELLIVGHNVSEEQRETIAKIIDELPQWMHDRTRYVPVQGGTRTTPLNKGFEAATGKYITILDDDDIAFDNWVEEFYNLYQKHNGKILHTYTVRQDWEVIGGDYPNTARAIGSPINTYCRDFNFMEELSLNSCPPGGLAFPSYAFKEWGIRFDETLNTAEDWDYLMRCAFLTGVANSSEVTFLYRQWCNAESSATVHNQEEWDRDYSKIVNRFVRTPIIMPSGALHGIIDRHVRHREKNTSRNLQIEQELFYDEGAGFNANHKMKAIIDPESDGYNFCFVPKEDIASNIAALRFDPSWLGGITVTNLLICVVYENDVNLSYNITDVRSNGCAIGERLVFLKSDPQITVRLTKTEKIKKVQIKADIIKNIEDEDIVKAARSEVVKSSLIYRLCRKIYRKVKRLMRKRIG